MGWVLPMEHNRFPKVICFETIDHTNKDKHPLLKISARDTYGKIFVILMAFLPNERAWVFLIDIHNCKANTIFIIYLIKSENNYN